MVRKSFNKIILAVLFIFVLSSAALALSPHDALSARQENSSYVVFGMNDLNGLLNEIFSQANIAMFTSLMEKDQANAVNMFAAFTAKIPLKNVVVAAGITAEMTPFVQAAAFMPDSAREKLDRMANGTATSAEIVTLLLGDSALMLATLFTLEVQEGAGFKYYNLDDQVVFAAKDDLLLIASSPVELEASIGALDKSGNRLAWKRRFDSPNYFLAHIDFLTLAPIIEMTGGDVVGKSGAIVKIFKAPLELEHALTINPGSYLLSTAANFLDSFVDVERFAERKPEVGGSLIMAGGGKLLFALAGQLALRAEDFRNSSPELAAGWDMFVKELETMKISESDIDALLGGSVSIALGSDATVMGMKTIGGHIAITGREGVAANIFNKIVESPIVSESIPLTSLEVEGWDKLLTLNQEIVPLPVLLGVKKDTLFLGFIDQGALSVKPEVSPEVAKLLENPLIGVSIVDVAAVWDRLRAEVAGPNSLLSMAPGIEEAKFILNELLGADVSITLIKSWAHELGVGYTEFSVVDVPEEKQLLPRVFKIIQMTK
ncbi:MAG: hypothetical protein FWF87_05720 [Synergistaceae bacterium]|nr:hypothetical protein [Synergistaceae bacterium]